MRLGGSRSSKASKCMRTAGRFSSLRKRARISYRDRDRDEAAVVMFQDLCDVQHDDDA